MELTNEQQMMRNVVVTGAAGALGSRVVAQFLEAGCIVFGLGRSYPSPEVTRHATIHRLHEIQCDLTDPSSVENTLSKIIDKVGSVDAIIHCAGGFRFATADDIVTEDIDFLVDVNLRSSLLLVRSALRAMKLQNFGRIILVSSATALKPSYGVSAYTASKLGLHALTEAVAAEVKELDINIHCVAPSVIDTPANRREMPDADFAKWVAPDEIAKIMFLLTQPAMNPVRSCILPITAGT